MVARLKQRHELPLVPVLLIVVAVELVVHRMVLTALKPGLLEEVSPTYEVFATYAPFFYHLACLLAVGALTWMVADLVRDRSSGPMGWRVVVGLSFCTFLPVSAVGALVSSSQQPVPYQSVSVLLPYVNLFFLLAVVLILAASWARPLPIRIRAAFIALAAPLVVLSVSRFVVWMAGAAGPSPLIYRLAEKGRTLTLLSGYWLFLLLAPAVSVSESKETRSTWPGLKAAVGERLAAWLQAVTHPVGVIIAVASVAAVGILCKLYFAAARNLVEAALGLDLVPASGEALAYLGSLLFFVILSVTLAVKDRPSRMLAMGLALMALGGYQLAEPLGYLTGMTGLVALFRGATALWGAEQPGVEAAWGPPLVEARWRAYLNVLRTRLALKVGELETAVVATSGAQISRVFGKWRTAALDLRFVRRHGRLTSAEVTIGEVPSGAPDWVLLSRPKAESAGEPPSSSSKTDASKTGADKTDAEGSVEPAGDGGAGGRGAGPPAASQPMFLVDDREGLTGRLMKPEDRSRAAELVCGRVAVWWGIGVKFWADPAAAGGLSRLVPIAELTMPGDTDPSPGGLPEVTALLGLWAERAGIMPAHSTV